MKTVTNFLNSSTEHNKEILNWLGELAIIHADSKQTQGQVALVELFATKEGEVPWHVHHREDEGFFLLEGEMTLYIGDTEKKMKPGDFVWAPKDIPHRYSVDSANYARVLMTFSPPGFEEFVRATSEPANDLTPLYPAADSIDFEKVAELALTYGAEFVEG